VKAIVQNIVKSGMPPSHILKFLAVLIEDGNYFRDGFLFDCEIEKLDFNRCFETSNKFYEFINVFSSLGATRAMLVPAPNNSDAASVIVIKGKKYFYDRAKLVIQNFLLIK
jgi:hypothetical protein